MIYELWDTEAALSLGRFASEEEALRFVRVVLDTDGDEHANVLELAIDDDRAHNLSGDKLRRRARVLDERDEAVEARRPDFYGSYLTSPEKMTAGLTDRLVKRSSGKPWSPSKAAGTWGQRSVKPGTPNPIHGQQRDATVGRQRTQKPKKG